MIRSETDIFKEVTTAPAPNSNNDSNERIRLDFLFHVHCIYCFFLRITWVNKYNLLKTFIKEVRSIGSLSLLINTMRTCSWKVHAYKLSTVHTERINFDKVLLDHNRMLEDDLVVTQMKSELQWFCTLSDKNQECILISLLRSGGGAIIDQIFLDCCREYEKRLKINASVERERILKESTEKMVKESVEVETKLDEDLIHHPNNVLCKELRKEYDTMVAAYRKKIFGKEQKPKRKSKKGKKSKKSSKNSKKSSKKSKKSRKASKKQEETTIDRIEALPLHLALRIFAYLSQSDLQKARKVNGHWNWIVQQALSLRKTRSFLNNAISTIRKSIAIDDEEDTRDLTKYSLEVEENHRVSFTERKMAQLENRAAIFKKLRTVEGYPLEDYSIIVDSIQKLASELNKAPLFTASFHPRLKVPVDNTDLTNYPRMMYKDVDLIAEQEPVLRTASQSAVTLSEQSESLPSKRTISSVNSEKVISERSASIAHSVEKTWFCMFNANPLVINMQ